MKSLKHIGLGSVLGLALLYSVGSAAAQGVPDTRMVVLQVRKDTGRVVCVDRDFKRKIVKADRGTVVVTEEGQKGGLELLQAGDIIKVEAHAGRTQQIVVLRMASQESASAEE